MRMTRLEGMPGLYASAGRLRVVRRWRELDRFQTRSSSRCRGEHGLWCVIPYNQQMGKKFSTADFSKMTDDKALAIAAFGESVAAYRYIVLSEKARDERLRESFE